MAVDLDAVLQRLTLVNAARTGRIQLIEALNEDPTVTRTIDGASTLELKIADPDRKLITASDVIDERSWAEVDDLIFELVGVSKSGDIVTLTFEDSIVAALRRRTKKLSIKPSTMTRRAFAIKLAKEAKVDYAVDPAKRGPVRSVLSRSTGGETETSWDVLGDVASAVNWRRFSDGKQLVMGGDDWLMSRDAHPTTVREFAPGIHNVDFDLDVGKRVSDATLTVDVAEWDLGPGSLCEIVDLGPANGNWLVSQISRTITSPRAQVSLTRPKHVLKEPKKKANATSGDDGDKDYLPGKSGTDTGGTAANGAREKMVAFALAQRGDAYVWGANGPNAWDCSGLVYAATKAAGHQIPARTSAGQWAAVKASGKTMSVDQAIKTRGALLFIQTSEIHHVAISLGNGTTIEAKGTAYGTGVFNVYAPQYTGAGWWV